jgi:hypothetical protein
MRQRETKRNLDQLAATNFLPAFPHLSNLKVNCYSTSRYTFRSKTIATVLDQLSPRFCRGTPISSFLPSAAMKPDNALSTWEYPVLTSMIYTRMLSTSHRACSRSSRRSLSSTRRRSTPEDCWVAETLSAPYYNNQSMRLPSS